MERSKINTKSNSKSNTKQIMKLMMHENKWSTIVWVLLAIIIGVFPSAAVVINRLLINEISLIPQENVSSHFNKAIVLLLIMALFGIVQEVISCISEYIYQNSKSKVASKLEKKLYSITLKYPMEMFESSNIYNKIMMANQAVNMNSIDILKLTVGIGTNFITLISVFIILLAISWYLPLILLLAAIPSGIGIIIAKKYRYNLKKSVLETARKKGYLSQLFTKINALKEMRIFNLSSYLLELWEKHSLELRNKELTILAKEQRIKLGGKVIVQFSICFASIYLVKLIMQNQITIGDYVSLITATSLFQMTLTSITENSGSLYEMGMYLDALLDITSSEQNEDNSKNDDNYELSEVKIISLKNITFRYPQSETDVIKNVSLDINRGDRIAIVGYNGSGKTTLVNIIMGLYKNYEGELLINGDNVNKYSENSYFNKFTCIMQNFMKYDLSLRENIAFGNIQFIQENDRIINQIKSVGLKQDLYTHLDDILSVQYSGGIELSGGEWQKIAIARAMMRDSEIVVFDEPTASLDPLAEVKLFEQLNSLAKDKTCVIVSHRLGITRYCNKIVVMENGEIVEVGSHQQLLLKDGVYKNLFTKQACWYDSTISNDEFDSKMYLV